MSAITDIILSQVKESAAGKLDKNVLSGLSNSILGSVKQSAQSASGIEQLTQLFTGKTNAADSPVTALAANIFKKDFVKKLGLDANMAQLATSLLPTILSALVDKKNGLDIASILGAFTGGGKTAKSGKSDLLGTAVGLLGKFLKK
ncbi:MAG: hypothetical protein MJZ82_00220 [Paludibacteraceae bacterium]|nr:hypothetical protein [Paludibacteraceae bacterium]